MQERHAFSPLIPGFSGLAFVFTLLGSQVAYGQSMETGANALSSSFVAMETIAPDADTEIIPHLGNASDLLQGDQFIASSPLNLDTFCKNYPYNSRCVDNGASTMDDMDGNESSSETATDEKSSGWAITPEISTLGLGASVTKEINPNLNARLGINGFSIGANIEETDVNYDTDLSLFNVSGLVDFYPSKKSGFRVTGGLVINDNKATGTAEATNNTEFTLNNKTYSTREIAKLNAEVELGGSSVAPYLGIGFGNPVRAGKGLGFSFNLGVMFTGSPNISITPDFGPAATPALQAEILRNIEVEKKEIEDDLDWLNIYPVLSLGLSYQF